MPGLFHRSTFRHLSGRTDRGSDQGRVSPRRRGAGSVHGCRHYRDRSTETSPEFYRTGTKSPLHRHGRKADQERTGIIYVINLKPMNYVDYTAESPPLISFCTGSLGFERGLERAIGPVNIVAYCEIEAYCCYNLVTGMEAGILAPRPVWTDIKTFPAKIFRGKIFGILGG